MAEQILQRPPAQGVQPGKGHRFPRRYIADNGADGKGRASRFGKLFPRPFGRQGTVDRRFAGLAVCRRRAPGVVPHGEAGARPVRVQRHVHRDAAWFLFVQTGQAAECRGGGDHILFPADAELFPPSMAGIITVSKTCA